MGTMDLGVLLREAGLRVNDVGNWRARVRPGGFKPVGIVMHHTALTDSLNTIVHGRSDLLGPLANFHVEKSGLINLVSAGRANHAGPGAQRVLDETRADIAPSATAIRRGLRDDPIGNMFFYGFENENLGDGVDPWPPEQLDTMARAAAALCRHHGWTANRVISHAEWTRRKPDPRGVDMNVLRARVAHFIDEDGDDMPKPSDVTDEVPFRNGILQLQYDGGIRLLNADRSPAGTELVGFNPFSYPGLPPRDRLGERGFYKIRVDADGQSYTLVATDGASYHFGA